MEHIVGLGTVDPQMQKAIGEAEVQNAIAILKKYKEGKTNLENKIIDNEQWWKLRHWEQQREDGFVPATAWLWNTIVSKHADMEDGYPEMNIMPKEIGDKEEAKILSSIIPVVLENNNFHATYSDACWYKLKQGCAIYGVFWDYQKLNGLGDISVERIDGINLFWEPGINDIQQSRNVFYVRLVPHDVLLSQYPQLQSQSLVNDQIIAKYLYDENVDSSDKSPVIDWYYKKRNADGKTVLHYVKFVNTTVLYATENETTPPTKPIIDPATGQQAVNPETGNTLSQPIGDAPSDIGLYDNGGLYPFVFDSFYDIEGTPFGYGYTDIFKDTQESIDLLNKAIVKNALMASKRRYFSSNTSSVNMEEFADWNKDIVTVSGTIDDQSLREIDVSPLPGTYVGILDNQINMLKETSGNRDVNNGGSQSGITAASALAVLQEAGNKGSRDLISGTYEAMKLVTYQIIELIRQFYDTPRQFRIIGEKGAMEFISYDNSKLRSQDQGMEFGIDMGFRTPQFDVEVSAQKATPYNKLSNNELALQFYQLGFFNPANATQAEAVIDMMDFDQKQDVMEKIQRNGTLLQIFQQLFQLALGMAQVNDPRMVPIITQMGVAAGVVDPALVQQAGMGANANANGKPDVVKQIPQTDSTGNIKQDEHPFVKNMREEVQGSTQPR